MFLKNKNIIFKIRRSKVTDYAALRVRNKKNLILNSIIYVLGTQKNLYEHPKHMLTAIGKNIYYFENLSLSNIKPVHKI